MGSPELPKKDSWSLQCIEEEASMKKDLAPYLLLGRRGRRRGGKASLQTSSWSLGEYNTLKLIAALIPHVLCVTRNYIMLAITLDQVLLKKKNGSASSTPS